MGSDAFFDSLVHCVDMGRPLWLVTPVRGVWGLLNWLSVRDAQPPFPLISFLAYATLFEADLG